MQDEGEREDRGRGGEGRLSGGFGCFDSALFVCFVCVARSVR